MYPAVSNFAKEVDSAFYWIGGISVALLVGITAAMVFFIVKYRRSRNPKATPIEGNLLLEVTWIVIPTILVLFMFFKGYEGFKLMRSVPEGAKVIKVVGQRWYWTFNYPELGITSDRLFVPIDTPIKLEMTAPPDDVVHSLYLPDFRVKEDCVPGKDTHLWFHPEEEGTFNIFCAEYCGLDHSKMITKLEVLSAEEYKKWVDGKIADRNKPVVMETAMNPRSREIAERDGEKLYKTYCLSCHGAEGQGGLVEGSRDFRSLAEWKLSPKVTDIFRTLSEGVDGTQMRSFANLPPWDRFALAHKVASFYQGSDRPASSPEEIETLKTDYELDKKVEPRKTIPIEEAMRKIADEAAEKSGEEGNK